MIFELIFSRDILVIVMMAIRILMKNQLSQHKLAFFGQNKFYINEKGYI